MIRATALRFGPSVVVAALIAGLAGCSSTPPPNEQLAAADLAVREADESEAATYAPGPLRRARDKLQDARAALQAEDHERARRLAEEALVDAQLAEAEARSEIAQNQLEEMRRSIDDLRQEAMGRS